MAGGSFPLSELRAAVLSSADWAPSQSTAFVAELDRFIWQAARRLATLAPGLLWAREKMWLQPSIKNSSAATDRLRVVSGDQLVLERPATDPARTPWPLTPPGLKDSYNLLVRTTAGITHRYKAHEFWTDQETGYERVSLDRPFAATVEANMSWRLFQDPWPLPQDVASIVDIRLWSASTEATMPVRGITEREMDILRNSNGLQTGDQPFAWCRGPSYQMQPPRSALGVSNAGTWSAGGDDTGVFEYVYTIAWGVRDADAVDPHGNLDPAWESPPSPVSAQATSTAGAGGAITVTWPSPDYIAHYTGLPTTGSVRNFRSGYYVIIYARRVSDTETPTIDELGGFYRLAISADTPGSFVHDGSQQVVYERPLRAPATCPTIRFWPIPTSRWEVDLRVVKEVLPLTVAADVLPVPAEAVEIVILDARRRLAEKCKEYAVAQEIEAVQIPRAVRNAVGTLFSDTNRNLVRSECDAIPINPRGYGIDELEHLLYGYRQT